MAWSARLAGALQPRTCRGANSFSGTREQSKNQILRLADCGFVKKKENVLITGSTSIGKSYIASAIGHQACSLSDYKKRAGDCIDREDVTAGR